MKSRWLKMLTVIATVAMVQSTQLNVSAAEYHEPVILDDSLSVEEMFFDKVDDDRVLPMLGGGFLHGSCVVVDARDESRILGIYNSRLDPNAVSIEEAKRILAGETKYVSVAARGATIPTGWDLYFLGANEHYLSGEFSASGWRFSNYMFKPESGTGDYLRWTSINDSGRVGGYEDAQNTLNGIVSGMELPIGQSRWYSKGSAGQIYYTYNPVTGTKYLVENPC